jgi:hypothetical protein
MHGYAQVCGGVWTFEGNWEAGVEGEKVSGTLERGIYDEVVCKETRCLCLYPGPVSRVTYNSGAGAVYLLPQYLSLCPLWRDVKCDVVKAVQRGGAQRG